MALASADEVMVMKNVGNVVIGLGGVGAITTGYRIVLGRTSLNPNDPPVRPDGFQTAAAVVFVLVGFGALYYSVANWR